MNGFCAIITAAGSGLRLGGERPKQFAPLGAGQVVLHHSIKVFLQHPQLKKLVCVLPDTSDDFLKYIPQDPRIAVCGGADTRAASVKAGVDFLNHSQHEGIVFIHDAARPFVSLDLINRILKKMEQHKSVCPVIPVRDTLRRNDQDILQDTLDRTQMVQIQTPQAFMLDDILKAYQNVPDYKSYTDESSLMSAAGFDVVSILGDAKNFKITYPEDLELARAVVSSAKMIKTGFGYDVHAFSHDEAGPVMLCGVPIPHPHRLKGHSDADVALHAICDAIFGVLGDGDIGTHFPPSDPQWKNAASQIFVEYARQKLEEKNARINHLDVTIICEEPKITPHREQMIEKISELLKLPPSSVGLKATTSEKLGFTGRGEGIVAQAVITVECEL